MIAMVSITKLELTLMRTILKQKDQAMALRMRGMMAIMLKTTPKTQKKVTRALGHQGLRHRHRHKDR